MTFAGKSVGRTELRKHYLFKRLSAGTCPCREWAAFVSFFIFSTLAHTSPLMSGGAIPASRYSSSILVGLIHPLIDLHALFSSGSNAVVLIMLAWQLQLEFDNFFRRLFRVVTFILVLCMCCL